MVFAGDASMGLTGNPDAEALNGRLLFAIPKKGEPSKLSPRSVGS